MDFDRFLILKHVILAPEQTWAIFRDRTIQFLYGIRHSACERA